MATGGDDKKVPDLTGTGTTPKSRHPSGSQERSRTPAPYPPPSNEEKRSRQLLMKKSFLKIFHT